jgi:hypothetical protein
MTRVLDGLAPRPEIVARYRLLPRRSPKTRRSPPAWTLRLMSSTEVFGQARHEFLLTDQLSGSLDQSDEDVESPAAEPNRLLAVQQEPSRREQAEGPERDRVLDWGGRPSGRLESILVHPRAVGRAFALPPVPNLCPCPSQQLGGVDGLPLPHSFNRERISGSTSGSFPGRCGPSGPTSLKWSMFFRKT